jgi:hypothetical protein
MKQVLLCEGSVWELSGGRKTPLNLVSDNYLLGDTFLNVLSIVLFQEI